MDEVIHPVGYQKAKAGQWLGRGWDRFMEKPIPYLVVGLIGVALTSFTGGLLLGPVLAGLAAMGIRRFRLERVELGDFFQGFNFFLPAFMSGLLVICFSLAGMVFLIIPGLVIFAMYLFTFHFIADQEQDFWEAMESSRRLVSQDYFGFSLFAALLLFLNFLGTLFFGVGCVATLAITSLAVTEAYLDLAEGAPPPPPGANTSPVRIE